MSFWILIVSSLALLVLYYVLLTRAVLEMLRCDANSILMTFAFLSLIPLPPTLILGIMVIGIWDIHKKEIDT